jgi:hypothetical protein
MRNVDGGKEGKAAVKDARMQECKDKVFCILALLNEKQQQKERISFACM